MHRLVVALLAALDAALAAVVGVAAALAPLALLWLVGATLPWNALWPTAVSVWQLGHLVPLHIHLPAEYLAVTGIDQSAASFVVSLAPLAFASFTAIFAARSGVRAAQAGAAATGPVAGTIVFAVLATLAGLTARNPIAAIHLWQGVLFPVSIYAIGVAGGALVAGWALADPAGHGVLDAMRGRVARWRHGWDRFVELAARGTGIALAGLIGLGALAVAVAMVVRGGNVIALFEAGHVDLLGVIVVALGQLAYLPTLVVWGLSFIAGPGFSVGVGTTVSPAGTQLGVMPGIPALGALPETTSPFLLVVVLLPVAVGALAGWAVRSRFADMDASTHEVAHIGSGLRATVAVAIAALSAAGTAVLCAAASGSLGPARLAQTGPEPGPVALAVGIEVLIGAAIMLLSPAPEPGTEHAAERPHTPRAMPDEVTMPVEPLPVAPLPVEPLPVEPLPVEPLPVDAPLDRPADFPAPVAHADAETGPVVLPPVPAAQPEPEAHAEPEPEPDEPEGPKPPPPAPSRPDLGPNRPNPLPPMASPGARDGSQ
jgi:hypothetical protein